MQTAELGVGREAAGADNHAGARTDVHELAALFDLNAEHAARKGLLAHDVHHLGVKLGECPPSCRRR